MKRNLQPQGHLSLLDTTSIIVGIIIGSAIFRSLPLIAHNTTSLAIFLNVSPLAGLAIAWILGGIAAYIGALCYAELATTYPEDGGSYIYLRRGLGRMVALLYVWIEFWIVRPGSVGAVAFVLGSYMEQIVPLHQLFDNQFLPPETLWAMLAVGMVTVINLGGVTLERWVQNGLTLAKLTGLAVIIFFAFFIPYWRTEVPAIAPPSYDPSFGLAMVLIMFAYGGWSDVVNIAAEVNQPQQNLHRALLLGIVTVVGIYLVTNFAFVSALGFDGLRGGSTVAADVLQFYWGHWGSTSISALIVVSCLGAIHGMIFTTSRAFYAAGKDHALLHWLGAWNEKREIPMRAVALQGGVTLLLIGLLGTSKDGFERLVIFTAPFFWFSFVMVALALVVLRQIDRSTPRPHPVPLFPVTPLLFAATSLWMSYSSLDYLLHNPKGYVWLWVLLVIISGGLLIVGERLQQRES